MTRKDYDTAHLINLLRGFKQRHPGLEIILEPGSAFAWQTGTLVSTIVDIVENHGIKTAILDVSFACHMPESVFDLCQSLFEVVGGGLAEGVEMKPLHSLRKFGQLVGGYS